MKVAVIACACSEIISTCRLTISRLAKEGHLIYAIIAPSNTLQSHSEIANVPKLTAIGVTQTFFIEKFDYSTITQLNADAVKSYIQHLEPSLVIMPSWKSPNNNRRILSRTSLIACRGIGTILMYELDANNASFSPIITFEASTEPPSEQATNNNTETATEQDEIGIKTFTSNSMLENKASKTSTYEGLEEKFESHRTLLLEEEGLF
ncbi:MAG TPA: hypothetical protein VI037_02635 [Nitrososphaera sp.]